MDEKTVKEVLTEAFSKVLSALQNPPGNLSSSQHDGGSFSDAGANKRTGRSGTTSDSDDSIADFVAPQLGKKKR